MFILFKKKKKKRKDSSGYKSISWVVEELNAKKEGSQG
jgi:hypothetical protein